MRRHQAATAIAVTGLMVLAACSPEAEAPPTPVVEPTPGPVAAPTSPPLGYACESGQTVTVRYPDTSTAQLNYRGQDFVMRLAPAATGARYSGSGMEWWTANQEGQETATLSRLGPNEDVGVAVLERCSRPSNSTAPTGPTPGQQGQMPGAVLPAAVACRGPQLKLSADGGDAGVGNRVTLIGVQNIGTQPCSLTGYPTVELQDLRGRNLTAVRTEQTPATGQALAAAAAVTLAPQAKGFFDIAFTVVPNAATGETCPSAARIRFTAPGDTSPVNLDQTFTPCGGRIRVSSFRAVAEPVPPAPAQATQMSLPAGKTRL